MFLNGENVPQDYIESVKWYRKAAELGDAGAQYSLGVAYLAGNGVQHDYKEAVKWFRKAADQALAKAQGKLGTLLFKGAGVSTNYEESYSWLILATANGDESVKKTMDELKKLMTPAQIEKAQKLAKSRRSN